MSEPSATSRLVLPDVPAALADDPVAAWREPVDIDTYEPAPPDRYPMFLASRVYQGSSGAVYPIPFVDRISREKRPRAWDAVHLENTWLRLMVLPELGGRIHVGLDRTTGYDFFYRNNVIKPALVGLAGPWISGGVELNWPQHHRPATFMPVDVHLEHGHDGSVTVWCSDHDPFHRMKGMHGVTLYPDRAVVELRVRLYNRSDDVRTFLWWANAAARVHEQYQSFFPPDVHEVADHARRAVTGFPRATQPYYGVDYAARVGPDTPDADRIDWYRTIPVPTSYMCVGSRGDFFGGYDHAAGAGFVHWADHRIAPGKKQWTWGTAPFGQAWDRHLSDGDGPYVELMAGVYTDNQPDFSFLGPGETKAFSQYWYPIQQIGPVDAATTEIALSLRAEAETTDAETTDAETTDAGDAGDRVRVAVAATRVRPQVDVRLDTPDGTTVWATSTALGPGCPLVTVVRLPRAHALGDLSLVVAQGQDELLRWRPPAPGTPGAVVTRATPAPAPQDIASGDELYLTGVHLAQYRHATRRPEPYWQEALRRDPGDARSATALAQKAYERAEYDLAEELLGVAVRRLTALNQNPSDGLAHYRLGLTLTRLGRFDEADDALAKAAWDVAWRAPAHVAAARRRLAVAEPAHALRLLDDALRLNSDHLAARDLRVIALRALGRAQEAQQDARATLDLDPLDWWARDLAGDRLDCDARTHLDVADEYAAAGSLPDALRLVEAAVTAARAGHRRERWSGVVPVALYRRAWLLEALGRPLDAAAARQDAAAADRSYCFPSGLDDESVLRAAVIADPKDGAAAGLLGHWRYDRGRHDDALAMWRLAAQADPDDAVVQRNLAIGAYSVEGDPDEARRRFALAMEAAPGDARLLLERDQLARRLAEPVVQRRARLEARPDLVGQRDDLTLELVSLLITGDEVALALELLAGRDFQPWEGGEGRVVAAWERAQLRWARDALAEGRAPRAESAVRAALDPPLTLGEAPHPLANRAPAFLALGDALAAQGRSAAAREAWLAAAAYVEAAPDVSDSDASDSAALDAATALRRVGEERRADALLDELRRHAQGLAATEAEDDYFATSVPAMVLLADDPAARRRLAATFLRAQADAGLGQWDDALRGLDDVLALDPAHAGAVDLRRRLERAAPAGLRPTSRQAQS